MRVLLQLMVLGVVFSLKAPVFSQSYPIVGTNQTTFFNNRSEISAPQEDDDFYGQNATYPGNKPSYTDNNDGTVRDNVTGLMWQQSFDHNSDGEIDVKDKLTYEEIEKQFGEGEVTFAGYDDWRLPTIKEMYSLIQFSGRDLSPESSSKSGLTPFIDNAIFEFAYGDAEAGERLIDMQCASSNIYVSKEVPTTVFGVNFADGRIKGYGLGLPGRGDKLFNYLLVRDNTGYGENNFVDNADGTISDKATGLMWLQNDSGEGMTWQEALAYAEGNEFAGYSDWRLPDAKELQSIVDYSRSPATTNSAAINPFFHSTQISDEAKETDFPCYWTSTTHARDGHQSGASAVYVAFGKSLGNIPKHMGRPAQGNVTKQKLDGEINWIDIHGAGSQRSDPKTGNPNNFSEGRGPQGDAIRINNYVRLVRTASK